MALTSSQKSGLRSLGQTRDVALTIGKAGVTEPLLKELEHLLSSRELVKVRFPSTASSDRHAMAMMLAESCGAERVGEVGHTGLFYRSNEGLSPAKRVALDQ